MRPRLLLLDILLFKGGKHEQLYYPYFPCVVFRHLGISWVCDCD